MPQVKSAVIIGAGIGGIATAIFLAKKGYSVTIYEKNSGPGGRCSQLIRDGHRFDLGATMLLMPGIYREVFNALGIDFGEDGTINRLDNLYKIYFDDGETLSFSTEEKKMETQLEAIEAGSFRKSQKYIAKGYEFFRLAQKKLIKRNFYSFSEFATFSNILLLFKLKTYISHNRYIKRFFRHPHLRMAYTFQNIYVGQSPFDSPALFSMVPAAELKEGSFFPEGGMFAIVKKLADKAEQEGVKFKYNIIVTGITVKGDRAEGITLYGGDHVSADLVVVNADLPYAYRVLLPDIKLSRRLERKKYSCSAICFHWGLDKEYPQLEHHNVFLSDGYRISLDRIFRDKLIDDRPSFYVHAPVRTDKSAAPEGEDTLSVIVGVGHVDKNADQDWIKMKQQTRSAVFERLRQMGIEDIEDHIKFEICYTPESWEGACNVSRGSVFGSINHSIFQMGYFRPHNRHKKYRNLFFVGGSTHPGNGIPNVLLSARLTSEHIFREEKEIFNNHK